MNEVVLVARRERERELFEENRKEKKIYLISI